MCVSLCPLPLETSVKSDNFILLAETLASEEGTDCHVSYSNLGPRSSHFAYDAVTSAFVRYLARRYRQTDTTFLGDTPAKSHTNNKVPPACLLLCIGVRPIARYSLSIVLALHHMVYIRIRRSDKPWRCVRYCPLRSPHDPLRSRHIRQTLALHTLLYSMFAARRSALDTSGNLGALCSLLSSPVTVSTRVRTIGKLVAVPHGSWSVGETDGCSSTIRYTIYTVP